MNIELRQVADATRVGVRFLHAIEADDFSAIPGGIYARSFIRAYSKHVGMDEEEAINRYRKQTNQNEDEINEPQPNRDFPSEPSQLSLGLALVGLLAVIGLGGYAATRYFSNTNQQPAPAVQAPAATSQPVTATVTTPPPPATQPSTTDGTTPAATGDPAIQQVVQTENLVLSFSASGDSWISVRADDQPNSQMLTIQPDQTKEFRATSKFKVTVGNLPAVKVLINGQPAKLPSSNGLLASNVIISKENFQEFVAAASNPNAKLPKPEVKKPKPVTDGAAPAANLSGTPKPAADTKPAVPKPAATNPANTNQTQTQSTGVKPPAAAQQKPAQPKPSGSTTGSLPPPTVKPITEAKPSDSTEKPKPAKPEEKKPENQ